MERDRMAAALHAGCSALSWDTEDGRHLWGRNLDFNRMADGTAVTYLPRGTAYALLGTDEGAPLPRQPRRRSAYAAVGMGLLMLPCSPVLYEGINDQGLMGGQLYYRGFAFFPDAPRPGTQPLQPPLAVYHLLAQCASVEEVVRALEQEVTLVSAPLLGTVPPLHWSFCDRSGESIIIEPDRDGLHIYRRTLGVMTNSPGYPWHRQNLWNYAGLRDLDYDAPEMDGGLPQCFSGSGAQGLPGDWSSPSRFVRLAFLKRFARRGADEAQGVGRMLHLFQSAAFPLGAVRVSQPGEPTVHDGGILPWDYTVYTAVMCAESLRYYWTTYENQRVQYADLHALADTPSPVQLPLELRPDFLPRTP